MKNMTITQELANFCKSLRYEDLPPEVVHHVEYLLIDFVAVGARGAQTEIAKTMRRSVLQLDKGITKKGSVLIGRSEKCSPLCATLANGTSAHVLSMDILYCFCQEKK